ncbi:hypothetical protein BDN72DRAFT_521346 [Pluteus cervinus]|uniref:Uncharacterized protein n=1 Tax=Pluteus cervinus TaxID=181527 RepID=A0ACD3AY35_9AGAR|nr:hypothetical protein BDN72DRAFT_521346 [Pluteus cervinus]
MTLADKYSDLSTLRKRSALSAHLNPVSSIALSSNGSWLACGDEGGTVSIAAVFPHPHVTQYLQADSTIRSLVWHPVSKTPSLIIGAQNGDVWFLRLKRSGKLDHERSEFTINARIDAMAISTTGRQLAIGCSNGIAIVDGDPFENWPPTRFLHIPRDGGSIRNMHYLGEDELVVTFLTGSHIMSYSTVQTDTDDDTDRVVWTISVRRIPLPSLDIGSSAVSPDGKLLAVVNLKDGIDWYDLDNRHFMCTTLGEFGKVDDKTRYGVGIAFLDNESVAIGNGRGRLSVASYRCPRIMSLNVERERSSLIQLVTIALRDGTPPVIVTSCGSNTRAGRAWNILFIGETRTTIWESLFVWFSAHYKTAAIVLILAVALVRMQTNNQDAVSDMLSSFIGVLSNQTISSRSAYNDSMRNCTCPCVCPDHTVTATCVTHTVTSLPTSGPTSTEGST